jgi:hypothetical protein
MQTLSRLEKFFVALGIAVLFCSVYYLNDGGKTERPWSARRDTPVGQIELSSGDTRWAGESQAHHFRTWEKQRLYSGDSLYSGASSRLGFLLGPVRVDLKSHTRLTLTSVENLGVEALYGEFEIHLPPGERLRVSSGIKTVDLSSVNGGRVNVQIETDRSLRVQNLAGDLIVKTEGKAEYTVPEEEIFRASGEMLNQ